VAEKGADTSNLLEVPAHIKIENILNMVPWGTADLVGRFSSLYSEDLDSDILAEI